MNRIGRINLGKETLQFCKEYFSFLAIGTIILGYVSFYSYAARYSLLYVSPNITFITGLGVFCLLLIFFLYIFARTRSIYRGIRVFLLIWLLILVNDNPLLILAVFYGFNLNIIYKDIFAKRPRFKKLRKRRLKFNRNDRLVSLTIFSIFLIIGIFFSIKLFVIYIFLDAFIQQLEVAIYQRARVLNLFIIIILLPIFIFGYFINNSSYTIFGITQQPISIIKNDSTILDGTLVYKDENNLYLKDSSFILNGNPINASFSNSIDIRLNDVKSYKTVQKKETANYNSGFIDLWRK